MTATHHRPQPILIPEPRSGHVEIADRVDDMVDPQVTHPTDAVSLRMPEHSVRATRTAEHTPPLRNQVCLDVFSVLEPAAD
jgi:hypothetical protein